MKKKCSAVLLAAFFLWNTPFSFVCGGEAAPQIETGAAAEPGTEQTAKLQSEAGVKGTAELQMEPGTVESERRTETGTNEAAESEIEVKTETTAAAGGETAPLNRKQIVICNNAYSEENPCSPMVYITKLSLMGTGFTIRIYDREEPGERTLLGSRAIEDTSRGFTVGIPVRALSPYGDAVFITLQEDDREESKAVKADYEEAAAVYADMAMLKARTDIAYDKSEFAKTGVFSPKDIKAGSYYVLDVRLNNFHTVGGATIPIRYNTDYLQLVPISASTKKINTSGAVSAPQGEAFGFSKVGTYKLALQCGVLPGVNTDYGTVGAVDEYPNPPLGDPGEYPYVNTATGLVKLEVSKRSYGPFDYEYDARTGAASHTGNWKGPKSVVRLVFRATSDAVEGMSFDELFHFATAEDYRGAGGSVETDGTPDDRGEAAKYYATQHPAGVSVALEDAQLLRTPPASDSVDTEFTPNKPVELLPEEIPQLPDSFEDKAAAVSLPENSVKVYNYTNYQSMSGGLDANLHDRLVLSSSREAGVILGDLIRVYGDSGLTQLLGEAFADSEGAASVDLGNQLDPKGGNVYVTNTRAGVASSAVAFGYPPEAQREVIFRIFRTRLPAGVAEGADPRETPEALGSVGKGEQFQIRVCFNDINDLMGYTLPIHFNTQTVRAADRYFRPIERDGYMSESDFFNGRTPFSVGTDISELTMNELIIYYAEESEIPGVMEQLGIAAREEFDRRKRDIAVKIDYGASGEGGGWNGGLLFTGPRSDGALIGSGQSSTAYPYVDNNVSEPNDGNDGLIKLWSTSLTSPVSRLYREEGYHFLNINFIGIANMLGEGAEFRFANTLDESYDGANPQGGRMVLSGPEPEAGKNVTFRWEVYSMDEISIPSGVTVGGIVGGGKPGQETTVTLMQNGEAVYTTTIGGIEAENGTAGTRRDELQQTGIERGKTEGTAERSAFAEPQTFTLEGVMPGAYTMRFSRDAHADVVISGLKVTESSVDLTQSADPRLRTITLPCGDISGDGRITLLDRQLMKRSGFYGRAVASLPAEQQAEARRMDLNGDGFVKLTDLQILMAAENYGKGTVYIDMEE